MTTGTKCELFGGPLDGQTRYFDDPTRRFVIPASARPERSPGAVAVDYRFVSGTYEPRELACACGRRAIVFVWLGWSDESGQG